MTPGVILKQLAQSLPMLSWTHVITLLFIILLFFSSHLQNSNERSKMVAALRARPQMQPRQARQARQARQPRQQRLASGVANSAVNGTANDTARSTTTVATTTVATTTVATTTTTIVPRDNNSSTNNNNNNNIGNDRNVTNAATITSINGMQLVDIKHMQRVRDRQLQKLSQSFSNANGNSSNNNNNNDSNNSNTAQLSTIINRVNNENDNSNEISNTNNGSNRYVNIGGRFSLQRNNSKNNSNINSTKNGNKRKRGNGNSKKSNKKIVKEKALSHLAGAFKDTTINEGQAKKLEQKLTKMLAEGKDITDISRSQLLLDIIEPISDYDDDIDLYDNDPVCK